MCSEWWGQFPGRFLGFVEARAAEVSRAEGCRAWSRGWEFQEKSLETKRGSRNPEL